MSKRVTRRSQRRLILQNKKREGKITSLSQNKRTIILPATMLELITKFLHLEEIAKFAQIQKYFQILCTFPTKASKKVYTSEEVKKNFNKWNITELDVEANEILEIPSNLFSTLRKLRVISFGEKLDIRVLTNISNLEEFSLNAADIDPNILTRCTKLRRLDLFSHNSDCKFLKQIPNLTSLDIKCSGIKSTQVLDHYSELLELNLGCCILEDIKGLEKCSKLQKLNLNREVATFVQQMELFPNLEKLSLTLDGLDIRDYPNFNKTKIHSLTIDRVNGLLLLPKSLTYLNIFASNIHDLSEFTNIINLKFLELSFCSNIKDFIGLEKCSQLQILNVTDLDSLESLKGLHNHEMEMINLFMLRSIRNLNFCPDTKKLTIKECESLKNLSRFNMISSMENWKCIEELILENNAHINLSPMLNCKNLRILEVELFSFTEDYVPIFEFPNLKEFKINDSVHLSRCEGVFPNIKTLTLTPTSLQEKVTFLPKMFPNVETLIINIYHNFFTDLTFVNDFKYLTEFTLGGDFKDLSLLQNVAGFNELKLEKCEVLRSFGRIIFYFRWFEINLNNNKLLSDISSVYRLKSLEKVSLKSYRFSFGGDSDLFLKSNPGWVKRANNTMFYYRFDKE